MKKYAWIVVFAFIFVGCTSSSKLSDPKGSPYPLMIGSFNSQEQATVDSSYYNISLHMYPIWEKDQAQWLYVEQALFDMQDKPYRQRVYKVEKLADGTYKSAVYKLNDESSFIGKWKTPEYFDSFDPSQLTEREGCAVYLTQKGKNHFEGSTKDKECKSNLRGATYATSVVKIEKGKITSWDQGFDSEGNQVRGATKGGYIFDKIKSKR